MKMNLRATAQLQTALVDTLEEQMEGIVTLQVETGDGVVLAANYIGTDIFRRNGNKLCAPPVKPWTYKHMAPTMKINIYLCTDGRRMYRFESIKLYTDEEITVDFGTKPFTLEVADE